MVSQWVWNCAWDISFIQNRSARPNLLLLSLLLDHTRLLSQVMLPLRWACLESWPLLRSRLCSAARWGAALSCFRRSF